jgi:hypothetical protein
MNKKEIKDILIILNSSNIFKYPIGNKILHLKVISLESKGIIVFNKINQTWGIK